MLKAIEVPLRSVLTVLYPVIFVVCHVLAFLEKRREKALGAIGLFFIFYMWVIIFSGEEPTLAKQVGVPMSVYVFLWIFLAWAVTSSFFKMAMLFNQNKYIDLAVLPVLAFVLWTGYLIITGWGIPNFLHSRGSINLLAIAVIDFVGMWICLKRIWGKPYWEIFAVPAFIRWVIPAG